MGKILIKKEDGFHEGARVEATYTSRLQHFVFKASKWILTSTIESEEQDYSRSHNPHEMWKSRKATIRDLEGEGDILPIKFKDHIIHYLSSIINMQENHCMEIIDENGCRKFEEEMYLNIRSGGICNGYILHIEESCGDIYSEKEKIICNLVIPDDKMEWIHKQLTNIPESSIEIIIKAAAYEHVGQLRGLLPWMRCRFALEPKSWTPIVEANIKIINS